MWIVFENWKKFFAITARKPKIIFAAQVSIRISVLFQLPICFTLLVRNTIDKRRKIDQERSAIIELKKLARYVAKYARFILIRTIVSRKYLLIIAQSLKMFVIPFSMYI